MNDHRGMKKELLYVLVGSVVLSAVLGILIVLRNNWGWFEIRVILTTITVAVASLCGLAADVAKHPRGANPLPIAGQLLTAIAAAMVIVGMWCDLEWDLYWQLTATASIFAVATVHVCLLTIARLAPRFRWVTFVAWQIIFGLAALLSYMIVTDFGTDAMYQFVAVLAVLDAAFTLVIPLLHRISKADGNTLAVATPLELRSVFAIDSEIAILKKRIEELEKLKFDLAGSTAEPA